MRLSVRWTTPSLSQLENIQDYIAKDNPVAAFEVVEHIRLHVNIQLPEQPLSGRPGRVDGARELVITGSNHVVAYRVTEDAIEILAIKHGAQAWPDTFG